MKTEIYKLELFVVNSDHETVQKMAAEMATLKTEVPEILRINLLKIGDVDFTEPDANTQIYDVLETESDSRSVLTKEAIQKYVEAIDQAVDFD